ncbi:alpha-(1,6)-fucosyltransferase-like [Paramacrobiotus metropolitanus]|uniref:alpha-(1,6)-fucosyltransferase-like n=1 Tax=Paramacrobiotus metropolitanus TaxID=2943436 RepID=UPI00244588C1|nr:alpha-(1,6)-fucosyltransferase-like [Paramacrobiotus metropolitanus]
MANFSRFKRYLLIGLGLWFVMLFGISRMFIVTDLNSDGNGTDLEKLLGKNAPPEEVQKIKSALERIDKLQKQNDNLQRRLQDLRRSDKDTIKEVREKGLFASADYITPTKEFELARRRLENGIIEFWRYTSTHLKKLSEMKNAEEAQNFAKEMLDFLTEHKRVILKDIDQVEQAAGLTDWKTEKSREMTKIVQSRLHRLQHPTDCSTRKRLRCNLNKACGFGCQIHHATYCLIAGYALNRTVILESKNWRYSRKGWESVFLPVTSCNADGYQAKIWKDDKASRQEMVLDMPIVDNVAGASRSRPMWLPLAVPADLFDRIHAFHKNPPVWWLAQIVSYLWRYQPEMKEYLDEKSTKMGFQTPIVGVHVRRTDKVGTEAAKHEIEEYMRYVDEYYDQLEVTKGEKVPIRRVYLASDDPSVFQDCKTKFPAYDVVADVDVMTNAGLSKRYSDESLRGIISDVHFLSQTDYLVCTFSSQVCRLAYEVMQARFSDATDRYKSLDDIYYYGGQNGHQFEAILPHTARNGEEISFARGDLLGIAGNHWDGLSVAEHVKTLRKGKFPSYKADEHFVTYDMPRYEDSVDL